jgi:hypothetical protein
MQVEDTRATAILKLAIEQIGHQCFVRRPALFFVWYNRLIFFRAPVGNLGKIDPIARTLLPFRETPDAIGAPLVELLLFARHHAPPAGRPQWDRGVSAVRSRAFGISLAAAM